MPRRKKQKIGLTLKGMTVKRRNRKTGNVDEITAGDLYGKPGNTRISIHAVYRNGHFWKYIEIHELMKIMGITEEEAKSNATKLFLK